MNLAIIIFAHSEDDFVKAKGLLEDDGHVESKIHFCNSGQISRLNFLKNHPDEWLLFLDSDCLISKEILQSLENTNNDKQIVLAGKYLNPPSSTYLQRAHNFVANTWLFSSYRPNKAKKLLGGAFLIYSDKEKLNNITEIKELFWGAEDKLLSQQLLSAGYKLKFEPKFEVTHHTSKKLKHFVRRAWLQGYNDHFGQGRRQKEILDINYWLFELATTNPLLAPAVLVHFLILQLGKWFQKVRPLRSKESLK